jgi:hypothetical protein
VYAADVDTDGDLDVLGAAGYSANGIAWWESDLDPSSTDPLFTPKPVSEYHLSTNYPNPFNPTTAISYYLPVASNVMLTVYDVLGRQVATLVNEVQLFGHYQVIWDGSEVTSGIYFCRLQAGKFSATKKMVLLQ